MDLDVDFLLRSPALESSSVAYLYYVARRKTELSPSTPFSSTVFAIHVQGVLFAVSAVTCFGRNGASIPLVVTIFLGGAFGSVFRYFGYSLDMHGPSVMLAQSTWGRLDIGCHYSEAFCSIIIPGISSDFNFRTTTYSWIRCQVPLLLRCSQGLCSNFWMDQHDLDFLLVWSERSLPQLYTY